MNTNNAALNTADFIVTSNKDCSETQASEET